MSLAILLAQLRVANVRTLAAVAHPNASQSDGAQPYPERTRGNAAPRLAEIVAPLAPWEVDWCEPVALLVGNEGAGLPEEVERSADARIRIPMSSGIESLNAAAAAAVLFYEAARQRKKRQQDLTS